MVTERGEAVILSLFDLPDKFSKDHLLQCYLDSQGRGFRVDLPEQKDSTLPLTNMEVHRPL